MQRRDRCDRTSPLDNLQPIPVGQRRERGGRQRLVPVGHRRDVVLELQVPPALLPTQRLNRDLQVFLESNGIRNVPPIQTKTLARLINLVHRQHLSEPGIRRVENRVAILSVRPLGVEVVGTAKVVLRPGTTDRREFPVAIRP